MTQILRVRQRNSHKEERFREAEILSKRKATCKNPGSRDCESPISTWICTGVVGWLLCASLWREKSIKTLAKSKKRLQ